MADLLLVTTCCHADIDLVQKRLDYQKRLGAPIKKHALLLVNDGTIQDQLFLDLAKDHAESGLFSKVETRRILDQPSKSDWPYNVNHAWRTTAQIVAGMYGQHFDGSSYVGWFYYEPDVTPIHKDFATIMETQYVAAPMMQFMGVPNLTMATNKTVIRHLNGAAVYPISAEHYNQRMMLVDGLPWDVAGMDQGAISKIKEIPPEYYTLAFGTRDYERKDNLFTATQTLVTGETQPFTFTMDKQILHHGCKDGSFMELLSPTPAKQEVHVLTIEEVQKIHQPHQKLAPLPPIKKPKVNKWVLKKIEAVKADQASGMKFMDIRKKHKLHPKKLKEFLAA